MDLTFFAHAFTSTLAFAAFGNGGHDLDPTARRAPESQATGTRRDAPPAAELEPTDATRPKPHRVVLVVGSRLAAAPGHEFD